ncbi:hypothetical protein ODJ79_12605 [Actinoplanes sp. KI2]|uniref:hypothetical protein n=1 Tax=Actinoplanes sp. KI2 TaxID=2983315 RepID=UPI0021D5A448|nr:hypothetical protein [Actinoplanes sp. KI2]MCU7724560.1 hypothetical protein [Actinoplanes sp. KI2]
MSQTTPFVLAKQPIDFPNLTTGVAVKNAAKRFESAWKLPDEAAFALAAALVDPAADRQAIDPKDVVGHLRPIQTPDGNFLLTLNTRVWTALISGDGGNGRSRYVIQTSPANGVRPRPWPIGRHHQPAIVDYHPAAFEDMTSAVKLSAAAIRSADLVTQVGRNPRGVWNPPVVVLARIHLKVADGTRKDLWFLHTIDGSTRVEACHELTDIAPTAPIQHCEASLDFLRTTHARLIERFNTTPTSPRSLAAARAATMPALIVVGVVEPDGVTPIQTGFQVVINDYVESVHVQPRQFSPAAQSNVIGERFVLTLEEREWLTEAQTQAILGREPDIDGKPTVRAATLVKAVCDPENAPLVREFVVTEDNGRLTKIKRAKLIGPLVVRQFEEAEPTAERALMRAFTPELLMFPWDLSDDDSETLRLRCLADLDNGDVRSSSIAELMARGGPALCAAGLLLSDQESTVKKISDLRGSVDKVVEGLAKRIGGVNVLADAVAWADGEVRERPRQFDLEGNVKTDLHGDPLHFSKDWWVGNMGVRALAFTADGEIPSGKSGPGSDDDDELAKSPEDDYRAKESRLIENLMAAKQRLADMYAAVDEQQRRLMPRLKLRKTELYEEFPAYLTKLYNRYGQDEDDMLAGLGEDELPDVDPVEEEPEADDEEEE